jgi:hypothetical protein
VTVLLNYWFAYQLGKLPPRQQTPVTQQAAQTCRAVAVGREVAPGELYLAQNFAAAMWVKVVSASVLLFLLQELTAILLLHGPGRAKTADTGVLWLALAAAALLQVAVLVWRARWVTQAMTRQADGGALPRFLAGASRPHVRDFWIMLLVATALVLAIVLH